MPSQIYYCSLCNEHVICDELAPRIGKLNDCLEPRGCHI